MKPSSISRGAIAYAHARIRACRSRLLTRADAAPLFTAADPAAMRRVIAALEIAEPLSRLLRVYETAIRAYPHGAPLFRAFLRLHEMENVKLLWRVAIKHGHGDAVPRLWTNLGALASFPILGGASPKEVAAELARTPYAGIAISVARAHENDIAAAELAFDRWASQRLLDEARRLPRREALTRRLAELVVRERDAEIVRRGAKWYGLTSVSGTVDDVAVLRRQRLRLCRRGFVGSPFLLAPAMAVILLAEEEARALRALVEREGDEALDAPMMRALAGSQIGA
jgi:vacuolar-type H+-ATPase subunit C/Vma6